MPINHLVIVKLKPGVTDAQLAEVRTASEAMVGHVPGVRSFQMGRALASTAHRAKGFDLTILVVMDSEQSVLDYASHPAHMVVNKFRETLCEDAMIFDMQV